MVLKNSVSVVCRAKGVQLEGDLCNPRAGDCGLDHFYHSMLRMLLLCKEAQRGMHLPMQLNTSASCLVPSFARTD